MQVCLSHICPSIQDVCRTDQSYVSHWRYV
jgi:hypothetical protein